MRKRLCGKEEELKEGNYNWHAQKGKTGPDKGDTTLQVILGWKMGGSDTEGEGQKDKSL